MRQELRDRVEPYEHSEAAGLRAISTTEGNSLSPPCSDCIDCMAPVKDVRCLCQKLGMSPVSRPPHMHDATMQIAIQQIICANTDAAPEPVGSCWYGFITSGGDIPSAPSLGVARNVAAITESGASVGSGTGTPIAACVCQEGPTVKAGGASGNGTPMPAPEADNGADGPTVRLRQFRDGPDARAATASPDHGRTSEVSSVSHTSPSSPPLPSPPSNRTGSAQ